MSFLNFSDLINQKPKLLQDEVVCFFLTSLMEQIFGKYHGDIIINNECESAINHQLIVDNWEFIELHFNVPKRVQSTQKIVRQTFKYIVDSLNNQYGFQNPIQFLPKDDRRRVNGKVINVAYTILKL